MPDLMLGLSSTVSFVQTGHAVTDMQWEFREEGDESEQASRHELELKLININLAGTYYFNDWIGLSLRLPVRIVHSEAGFLREDNSEIEDFESGHHRDETLFGPGDLEVTAITRHSGQFTPSLAWFVSGSLGLTLPTGKVEDNPEVVGMWKTDHQHMFFGRGMPAPTLALNGSLRMDWGFVEGSFSATIPFLETASKEYIPPEGREWHEMGAWDMYEVGEYIAPHIFTGVFGVGSNFGTEGWTFTGQLQAYHQSEAQWQGFPGVNSGRTELLAGVRTSLVISDALIAELSVKVPVYLKMGTFGAEIEMPVLLGFGFYFTGDA